MELILLKVTHILCLILWIGSLFALLRLLKNGKIDLDVLKHYYLKRQLPLMLLALAAGLILFILLPKQFKAGWFHMKMTAVIGLIVCDIWLGRKLAKLKSPSAGSLMVVQLTSLFFLIMALFAVYGLRNKEQEWKKAYIEQESTRHEE